MGEKDNAFDIFVGDRVFQMSYFYWTSRLWSLFASNAMSC